MPSDLVLQQISGEQLYRNITEPLKVYNHGFLAKDYTLSDRSKREIKFLQEYDGWVSAAKRLFAADLLAYKQKELSLHIYNIYMHYFKFLLCIKNMRLPRYWNS